MKIKKSIIAMFMFLIILIFCYCIHIKFLRVNVIFYSAIYDVFIASIITFICIKKIPYFKIFNNFEKLQFFILWIFIGYSLAISVPTVIDRSLSFYILEKLQQRGGAIKQDAFAQIFQEEYLKEHRLVDVRLTEQVNSGTIYLANSCVILTKRGNTLATFSRFFRQNLLSKKRLLVNEYVSDLTDPFSESVVNEYYTCKIHGE